MSKIKKCINNLKETKSCSVAIVGTNGIQVCGIRKSPQGFGLLVKFKECVPLDHDLDCEEEEVDVVDFEDEPEVIHNEYACKKSLVSHVQETKSAIFELILEKFTLLKEFMCQTPDNMSEVDDNLDNDEIELCVSCSSKESIRSEQSKLSDNSSSAVISNKVWKDDYGCTDEISEDGTAISCSESAHNLVLDIIAHEIELLVAKMCALWRRGLDEYSTKQEGFLCQCKSVESITSRDAYCSSETSFKKVTWGSNEYDVKDKYSKTNLDKAIKDVDVNKAHKLIHQKRLARTDIEPDQKLKVISLIDAALQHELFCASSKCVNEKIEKPAKRIEMYKFRKTCNVTSNSEIEKPLCDGDMNLPQGNRCCNETCTVLSKHVKEVMKGNSRTVEVFEKREQFVQTCSEIFEKKEKIVQTPRLNQISACKIKRSNQSVQTSTVVDKVTKDYEKQDKEVQISSPEEIKRKDQSIQAHIIMKSETAQESEPNKEKPKPSKDTPEEPEDTEKETISIAVQTSNESESRDNIVEQRNTKDMGVYTQPQDIEEETISIAVQTSNESESRDNIVEQRKTKDMEVNTQPQDIEEEAISIAVQTSNESESRDNIVEQRKTKDMEVNTQPQDIEEEIISIGVQSSKESESRDNIVEQRKTKDMGVNTQPQDIEEKIISIADQSSKESEFKDLIEKTKDMETENGEKYQKSAPPMHRECKIRKGRDKYDGNRDKLVASTKYYCKVWNQYHSEHEELEINELQTIAFQKKAQQTKIDLERTERKKKGVKEPREPISILLHPLVNNEGYDIRFLTPPSTLPPEPNKTDNN